MSPETIASLCIDVTADYFGVTRKAILSRARPAMLCWPRHVAMTVAYELTTLSTPRIAFIFNRADHATILHAQRVVRGAIDIHRRSDVEAVRGAVLMRSKAA